MRYLLLVTVFYALSFTANANYPPDSLLRLSKKTENSQLQVKYMCDAAIWWRDKGVFDSAQIVLNQAELRALKQNDSISLGLIFYHQGGLSWRKGQYEEARLLYHKSIDIRNQLKDTPGTAAAYINLALVQRDISSYDASLRTLRHVRTLYDKLKDSAGIANVLSLTGGVYLRLNNYDSAFMNFTQSLFLRIRLADTLQMASSYTNLAILHKTTGTFDSSVHYFQQALLIHQNSKSVNNEAYVYLNLGGLYWEMHNYFKAIDSYIESLRLYEILGDETRKAKVLENIGLIYRDLGNIDRALEYHRTVLKLYSNVGNKLQESIALNFIAGDYWTAKEYSEALEYYKRVLEIRKELGNRSLMASTCNSLGMVYKNLDQTDSAHFYYQAALALYGDMGDLKNHAATLNNIANFKWNINESDSADFYFEMALFSRQLIQDTQGEGYSMLQYGEFLMEAKRFKKAAEMSKGAYDIACNLDDNSLKRDASHLLSRYYELLGNYKLSHIYFKEFYEIQNLLNHDETIKRIADMEIRFENEKKQQALELKQFEIELRDAQIKQKNQRYYYMLVALFLLVGVIVVVVIAWRQKIKTNIELRKQKSEIETQKNQIEKQKEKISDSITYARRIQEVMLPPSIVVDALFPNHFNFNKPRDVVSGDFYWTHREGKYDVLVVADCTGHGVPGAFMSMLGISLLNELKGQYSEFDAAKMLGHLRNKIRNNLHQPTVIPRKFDELENLDGMDMGMIIIDNELSRVCFAGGNIPLWVYSMGEIQVYAPDKMPVGIYLVDSPFTNTYINLQNNDIMYLFSDGYIDQFGGPRGRKLMRAGLKNVLEKGANLPLVEQKVNLENALNEWMGDYSQLDDIIVFGVQWKC
ncbi:MAG: tetratricopeptide repeat protein [Salinivirgaceae bacterium]|nr:tetratricopeptide repeat protein [Salinivirgaceae bacterium]